MQGDQAPPKRPIKVRITRGARKPGTGVKLQVAPTTCPIQLGRDSPAESSEKTCVRLTRWGPPL